MVAVGMEATPTELGARFMKVLIRDNKAKARWEAWTMQGQLIDQLTYRPERDCYGPMRVWPYGSVVSKKLLEIKQKAKGRTIYALDPVKVERSRAAASRP